MHMCLMHVYDSVHACICVLYSCNRELVCDVHRECSFLRPTHRCSVTEAEVDGVIARLQWIQQHIVAIRLDQFCSIRPKGTVSERNQKKDKKEEKNRKKFRENQTGDTLSDSAAAAAAATLSSGWLTCQCLPLTNQTQTTMIDALQLSKWARR